MSTCPPLAIAGQPSSCAGVGSRNARSNHFLVVGERTSERHADQGIRRRLPSGRARGALLHRLGRGQPADRTGSARAGHRLRTDQQVTVPTAFSGPLKLKERIGGPDAERIVELIRPRSRPPSGRRPRSTASRARWRSAPARSSPTSTVAMPSACGRTQRTPTTCGGASARSRDFGLMKITGLGSVLALQFGVEAARELVLEHPCLDGSTLRRGAARVPGREARPSRD